MVLILFFICTQTYRHFFHFYKKEKQNKIFLHIKYKFPLAGVFGFGYSFVSDKTIADNFRERNQDPPLS